MGFRFHKRIGLAKGLGLNLSKSGLSLSLGGKGASVNIGRKGAMGTVGIPGTGLSYRASSRSRGPAWIFWVVVAAAVVFWLKPEWAPKQLLEALGIGGKPTISAPAAPASAR